MGEDKPLPYGVTIRNRSGGVYPRLNPWEGTRPSPTIDNRSIEALASMCGSEDPHLQTHTYRPTPTDPHLQTHTYRPMFIVLCSCLIYQAWWRIAMPSARNGKGGAGDDERKKVRTYPSNFSTEMSSSRSSQWIPTPLPISRHLFLCSSVALRREGNHSNETAISRPSDNWTCIRSASN